MLNFASDKQRDLSILRWALLAVLLGRLWQFLRWPIYADKVIPDSALATGVRFFSIAIFVLAIVAIVLSDRLAPRKYLKAFLFIGLWGAGTALVLNSFFALAAKNFEFPQFIEHGSQFGIPFLYWYVTRADENRDSRNAETVFLFARILVASTFVGHGIFALNLFPMPESFVTMTLGVFGGNEQTAHALLIVPGILDLLCAGMILLGMRFPNLLTLGLLYATLWGLATASARTWGYLGAGDFVYILDRRLFESVFRLVHGLLPMYLLLHYQNQKGDTPRTQ